MMPILLMGAVGIFMIQQIGLTPILQARSDQIIAGFSPDHSNVHVLYAILEVMKFICLLIYSSRVGGACNIDGACGNTTKKPRILTDAGFSQKIFG